MRRLDHTIADAFPEGRFKKNEFGEYSRIRVKINRVQFMGKEDKVEYTHFIHPDSEYTLYFFTAAGMECFSGNYLQITAYMTQKVNGFNFYELVQEPHIRLDESIPDLMISWEIWDECIEDYLQKYNLT